MRVAVIQAVAVCLVAVTFSAEICEEGSTWKKDCNDCNCSNGQENCTILVCQSALTDQPHGTPWSINAVNPIVTVHPIPTFDFYFGHLNIAGNLIDKYRRNQPPASAPNQPTIISISKEVNMYNAAKQGDINVVNSALVAGADPQWHDPANYGTTALHVAAANNHPAVVTVLLDAGVDKNLRDDYSRTPIYHASEAGSVDALMTLIAHEADVDIPNTYKATPVMWAAQNGHLSVVQELIKANADVNLPNIYGATPVILAAANGQLCVVQELIRVKANIHAADVWYGHTALHDAGRNNHQAIALLLLDNGADANKLDNNGLTPGAYARQQGNVALGNLIDNYSRNHHPARLPTQPYNISMSSELKLFYAAERGDLQGAKKALAAGADAQWHNPDNHGNTALHAAAKFNHPAVLTVILHSGVNSNLKGNAGTTPVMIAAAYGNLRAVKALIRANADVNIPDKYGATPILLAAARGHLPVVQELIKDNADVNLSNTHDETPLILAAQYGHLPIVQELLSANANIHPVGQAYTALHAAAYANQQAIAILLLENGADKWKLRNGLTPVDLAIRQGHFALANIIDNYTGNTG